MRLLLAFFLSLFMLPTLAVLQERDLGRTLGVLRAELEQTQRQQREGQSRAEAQNREQHEKIRSYMRRAEQISLMLYSQQEDFTFDMAYACQAATALYADLQAYEAPYVQIKARIQLDLDRYAALIRSLAQLPPSQPHSLGAALPNSPTARQVRSQFDGLQLSLGSSHLSLAEQQDRAICLRLARQIHAQLRLSRQRIDFEQSYYATLRQKVEALNRYALARYKHLQASVFFQASDHYLNTLRSAPQRWDEVCDDLVSKYANPYGRSSTYSEWRGPMVLFMLLFMLGYVLVAVGVSALALRFAPPRMLPADFAQKRRSYFTALGLFLFAVSIVLLRWVVDHSFILMAAGLMSNMAWLALAVVLSLLVRLRATQLGDGFRLYLPFVTMAFVVVALRVLFVPNALLLLFYPALLLLFTLWQIVSLRRPKEPLPTADLLYAAIAMLAMCAATVMAWMGYVLLAVQLMVWWMFQLAAVQSIACAQHLLARYQVGALLRRLRAKALAAQASSVLSSEAAEADDTLLSKAREGYYILHTWHFDFAQRVLLPVAVVLSVVFCISAAATMFEMNAAVSELFDYNFIDQAGVIQVSLRKLVYVLAFWFVFRYANYLARSFYHHVQRMKHPEEQHSYNATLANNLIAILVWGSYALYALVLLQVPKSGISVVTAGLATGMGFAMKDLLENFFYGISLMTGRVRVGDVIECDGIQGRVESMSYQSTQIVTPDGSLIAFLNSQLFNKNFKNLTRHNAYELVKISFGVSYGTKIERVRELLIPRFEPLNELLPDGRPTFREGTLPKLVFTDFGDSSVNLTLVLWVLVEKKAAVLSEGREIIYNTLAEHQIEIPYPQLDLHLYQR